MGMVNSLRFSGYKSFSANNDSEVLLAPNVSVFVGKNNCGKSTCIDMIEASFNYKFYQKIVDEIAEFSIGFVLDEEAISMGFRKNWSGGDISGNHYVYGSQFIGKTLYACDKNTRPSNSTRMDLKLHPYQPNLELPTGRSEWDQVAYRYSDFQNNYQFRRINAERDIRPEVESNVVTVDYNGGGATNILRKFVNHSEYDEKIVEEILLKELNSIMYPDSKFKNIRIQQIKVNDELLWEIFLEEENGKRFALSKSGSGLKTIILMLINLYVIPKIKVYRDKTFIYAFEELENNLHPALQRKVFEYLYNYAEKHNVHIFLTTHSHIAINTFYEKSGARIYHVTKMNGESQISLVSNYNECNDILTDLDVKASDLFQSNGIIWVEGPSDRIYINHWLRVFHDFDFIEGSDYQFLYYGGKNLSHYTTEHTDELINILTTNKNAAIVIDSDKRYPNSRINETKKRIQREFTQLGGVCWITKGKEIENYISAKSINDKYSTNLPQIGQYELFPMYIRPCDENFDKHKVLFAKEIVQYIGKDNSKGVLDLEKQIHALYVEICKWNKK